MMDKRKKIKDDEDIMTYYNKHERPYPMTLGCPKCKNEKFLR